MKYHQKYRRQGNSMTYCSNTAPPYITRNNREMNKELHPPFPQEKGPLNCQNYRGKTLSFIAAKIYNILQLNLIEPEIEKILRKNRNGFRKKRFTTSQILTIQRMFLSISCQKSRGHTLVCRFLQVIWFNT